MWCTGLSGPLAVDAPCAQPTEFCGAKKHDNQALCMQSVRRWLDQNSAVRQCVAAICMLQSTGSMVPLESHPRVAAVGSNGRSGFRMMSRASCVFPLTPCLFHIPSPIDTLANGPSCTIERTLGPAAVDVPCVHMTGRTFVVLQKRCEPRFLHAKRTREVGSNDSWGRPACC